MKDLQKVFAAILIIILVSIVALLAKAANRSARSPTAVTGGGDSHKLGDAILTAHHQQSSQQTVKPPPKHILNPEPKKVYKTTTGGKEGGPKDRPSKKPKKLWTEYTTWEKMYEDEEAHEAYWEDVEKVQNTLELDFTEVRKALAKTVYDDREWAGRVNYVDGKLQVVELVPSPYKIGKGPLNQQSSAMVPADVMAKLIAKPGLFLFHTHPGETPGSAMPSSTDMAGSLFMAYTGKYAAELVVSPYGVFLYAPSAECRQKVWSVNHTDPNWRDKAHLNMLRQVADFHGAFNGARSWKSPWSLKNYIEMAEKYGIEYVVFPNDNYAALENRALFSAPGGIDHDTHQSVLKQIKKLEVVVSTTKPKKTIVSKNKKATGGKPGGRVRRVHFAPGV